jgi:hypothetical protein
MSITATSNYISSASIEEWMETKTSGLYQDLGSSMDVSNRRADAEGELNHIKQLLLDVKNKGGDATEAYAEIQSAMNEYQDVPEVAQTLGSIAQDLSESTDTSSSTSVNQGGVITAGTSAAAPKATDSQIDDWTKSIGDAVDGLGKQDSLGLIDIQELNSEINQAKQIASALLDAANKASDAIISHIG